MKEKKQLTAKQQKVLAAAAIVIFCLAAIALFVFVGIPMIHFASEPEKFRAWVDARGVLGRLAYMGMVILQIVVAIIPGEPLEIVGGYAFGAVEGTLLCLAAATIGSLLVFWLVRKFGMPLVEVFFPQEKLQKLRFLKTSPKRDFIFLVIFMVPGTPKDLLCYFAGLTDMKLSMWLMLCSLGRIPSVVTSTIGGSALGSQQYWFAAGVFALTLVISAAGLWIYSRIQRKYGEKEAAKHGGAPKTEEASLPDARSDAECGGFGTDKNAAG